MAINIQEILHPSDSDSIKFEKINYNFDQILSNGGGPIGPKGQKGDQGQLGSTGQKGEKGDTGLTGAQGVSGSTDSPWYKVEVDTNNDGNNEVTILKPKVGSDLNMPIIWLGDPNFEEDSTDGDIDTNARLTIANDLTYENFIRLQHSTTKRIVLTSSVNGIYSKFHWKNDFGVTDLEYAITTDKITLTANTAPFYIGGAGLQLAALNNTNIKLSTAGTGILDVDINAEFKGYLRLPAGSTGARPATPQVGMVRFNTDLDIVEAYYYNTGSPEWRELCTDCGTAVGDSIGISGGDIDANADGSPSSNTISISGGDIDASADGTPVSSYTLATSGLTSLTAAYNTATTLYLNYTITPTSSDPTVSNVFVNRPGLTVSADPTNNRIQVVTSTGNIGDVWIVTVKHPSDAAVAVTYYVSLVSASVALPTSTAVPSPTPTPAPTPIPNSVTVTSVEDSYPDDDDVVIAWTSSGTAICIAATVQYSSTPAGPWISNTGSCTSPRTLAIPSTCGTTRYFRVIQDLQGGTQIISSVFTKVFTDQGCTGAPS